MIASCSGGGLETGNSEEEEDAPAVISDFIYQGASLHNQTDRTGETALHLAARYSRSDAAKRLLEASADANIQDNMGRTPLHAAVSADAQGVFQVGGPSASPCPPCSCSGPRSPGSERGGAGPAGGLLPSLCTRGGGGEGVRPECPPPWEAAGTRGAGPPHLHPRQACVSPHLPLLPAVAGGVASGGREKAACTPGALASLGLPGSGRIRGSDAGGPGGGRWQRPPCRKPPASGPCCSVQTGWFSGTRAGGSQSFP